MSHKANDIVTDNKLDLQSMVWSITDTVERSDELEQEVEAQDREEDRYDNSYEPTCGGGYPTWESDR